jgi:hypothetical protein
MVSRREDGGTLIPPPCRATIASLQVGEGRHAEKGSLTRECSDTKGKLISLDINMENLDALEVSVKNAIA